MYYVRRTPFQPSPIPHMDTQQVNVNLRNVIFSDKEETLLKPTFVPFSENNKNYDLVYILKETDINPDLKYSLRSICKFCTYRNIWFVGYQPTWTKDVNYIHTVQTQNKWKNSVLNYIAACKCPDISDDFILMNDDFFAIRQIVDWTESTNKCLGTLDEKIRELSKNSTLSRWQSAFTYAKELLTEFKCPYQYNYETHLPIIINKNNFLEMITSKPLQCFEKTDKVLHKRSVYKNLYQDQNIIPKKIIDVKLLAQKDLDSQLLEEDWLSVFDYVIDNARRYPRLNKLFRLLFSEKCKYER